MRLPHRALSGLPTRTALLTAAAALTAPALAVVPAGGAAAAPAGPAAYKRADQRQITYTDWDTGADFRRGAMRGVVMQKGRLKLGAPVASSRLGGTTYDKGIWTGPWSTPGHAFTELVASWEAVTPKDSHVVVRVRGRDASGARSSWDTLARWAAGDAHVKRSTFGRQDDDLASVNVDTWQAKDELVSYQLRVELLRRAGSAARPSFDTVGAVASRLTGTQATSRPGPGRGIVLPVPRYSQYVHSGHYPQWGGGGEAWCSPTSTSMVLAYYDALPGPRAYSWVPDGHPDPVVDLAARMTYDHEYDGTGNWPFNTAYAATRAGHAFVTRLRSLREAERFIAAGIPLVVSVAFGAGELDGAPISSTNGHLMVIVGFTRSGDVVVNDPAGRSRKQVRRTYDRGQFEDVWLPTSGGLTYVVRDDAHPLPTGNQTNW
ncbi:MAG: hypothetical protein CMH83_18340 [Nocardioides sp.]|nr:hypothetical protein [Nocardioides sp.]